MPLHCTDFADAFIQGDLQVRNTMRSTVEFSVLFKDTLTCRLGKVEIKAATFPELIQNGLRKSGKLSLLETTNAVPSGLQERDIIQLVIRAVQKHASRMWKMCSSSHGTVNLHLCENVFKGYKECGPTYAAIQTTYLSLE